MQQAEYKAPKPAKEKRPRKRKDNEKRMSKGSRVLLIIVCIVVGIALLLAATVFILDRIGHGAMTDSGDNMRTHNQAETVDAGRVRYKGKLYQYNDDISTILFMGVDSKQKKGDVGEFGRPNQTDVVVLCALDPNAKRITLVSISRDSMCDIEVLDDSGKSLGMAHAQLALSYAYGDGGDISCQLTSDAVSRLFYGLPISAYGSIYMDGVGRLTDLVGGITVTPNESFGVFKAGQPVTLNSSNTESYLRYRDHSVEGNNGRMERHKGVILELAKAMLRKIRQNPASILSLYDGVQKNVTTNLDAPSMVYLARIASGMSLDTTVRKVEGTSVLGAQNHAEYNVDETALYELILEIFYEPVKG